MATADPPGAAGALGGASKRPGNRKWLVIIGATPLVVALIAALVSLGGPSEPAVHITPPAGYQAITDAYWGYAIPGGWKQDSAYTDSNGDFFYRGAGGWAAETLRLRDTPSALGEPPPRSLASFGQVRATPYRLVGGRPATVPGAEVAWSYDLVRSGVTDQVINAWLRGARTEIWLLVQATPERSSTILASLRA